MAMQGLLNYGDEVLLPAPDYPLWTAAVSCRPVRRSLSLRRIRRLDARSRRTLRSKITPNTKRSSSSTRTIDGRAVFGRTVAGDDRNWRASMA